MVGHAQDTIGMTGVSVVLAPNGAVCGVDVRGSAPGTRETCLLYTSSGGTGNYNGVSNQELTDAIAAAGNAFTEESVQAAYSELQKVLMERVPQIGLYYRMNSIILSLIHI